MTARGHTCGQLLTPPPLNNRTQISSTPGIPRNYDPKNSTPKKNNPGMPSRLGPLGSIFFKKPGPGGPRWVCLLCADPRLDRSITGAKLRSWYTFFQSRWMLEREQLIDRIHFLKIAHPNWYCFAFYSIINQMLVCFFERVCGVGFLPPNAKHLLIRDNSKYV